MKWFNKLTARLLQPRDDARQHSSLRNWSLEPRPQAQLEWTPKEIGALLDAEKRSQLCYATCQEYNATLQSVILGFDLRGSQLLLDDFFPSPAAGVCDNKLTLSLPTVLGSLCLEVEIIERVTFSGGPALVAHISKKRVYPTGRPLARVAFCKDRAPAVELLLAMTPLMHGHVVNLSHSGLLMSCAVAQKPSLFTHHGACKIAFSEQFRLQANARVHHVSFHRKPFRHSLLRIEFYDLNTEQKDQLDAFIQQFEVTAEHSPQAA